jgi:hypothetical protein
MRVVEAAREVARDRAKLVPALVESTGLSREGVELAFERHLELDPTDAELESLVASAGDAERVVVVLSANVFVGALRAIAMARASSARVVVRPSRREPHFARALVEAMGDAGVTLAGDVDYARLSGGEVHVYGRNETIHEIRARVGAGLRVRGHGAGMGVALVTGAAPLEEAAAALADDVIPFDQRGCLSPRIALVVGDLDDAGRFSRAHRRALVEGLARVPLGRLDSEERAASLRWVSTLTMSDAHRHSGEGLLAREGHSVFLVSGVSRALVGPSGRNVVVAPVASLDEARAVLAELSPAIVAVGSDDPAAAALVAPPHARVSALGEMQRPRLDGPVDRRDPFV